MKLPKHLSKNGVCSECGVGFLELCPPCEDAYLEYLVDDTARRRRPKLRTVPVRIAIWVVRGLRRLFEALSGRRGS